MSKSPSKQPEPVARCPGCGAVLKAKASSVPHDPEGCIVLRNRRGIAAKCRTPLDRDCRACPVWLKMKEEKQSVEHAKPTFAINTYDRDGDTMDEGIFLHFGDTTLKVADDKDGFAAFIEHLNSIETEIRENW
jgi:hypothetical protein